ncbi:MAG: chromate transporter [Deltaproteobacteria bacterium]|nr:chromate transporter [Deltaproteobacteria bacterium]
MALVANAAVTFGKTSLKSWTDGLIAAGAAAILVTGANPILVILGAGVLGLGLYRGWARDEGAAPTGAPPASGARRAGTRIALLLAAGALGGLGILYFSDRKLFELAALMFRVDFFAFGGGFGSLPILLHEVVEVRHWLDATTFLDGIALGQVTPGPIVITATFVGHQIAGLAGAVVGTVAIFLPSLVILVAAVPHLDAVRHRPFFRKTLRGILSSFVGLLLSVALHFGRSVTWSPLAAALALLAFFLLRRGADVLWVVLGGALVSALFL